MNKKYISLSLVTISLLFIFFIKEILVNLMILLILIIILFILFKKDSKDFTLEKVSKKDLELALKEYKKEALILAEADKEEIKDSIDFSIKEEHFVQDEIHEIKTIEVDEKYTSVLGIDSEQSLESISSTKKE